MSAPAAIRAGQQAAERLMISTCTVVRIESVRDPDTYVTTQVETPVYAGKYRLTTYEPYETVIVSAGRTKVEQRYQAHFPVGSAVFRIGDLIRPSGSDRTLRVAGLLEKTFQTAIRLLVDEDPTAKEVGGVPSAP